jgi:FAD-dependent urate hydroxylase
MTSSWNADCEVAVIGAGPYGLAVAAHLKAANIAVCVFGDPLSFWRDHMPKGMKLRSPWIASHISDPHGKFTLDEFACRHGIAPVEDQLSREQFISYGEWFRRQAVPEVDTRMVMRIEDIGHGFGIALKDGTVVRAPRVVLATGLAHQEFRPPLFAGMPRELVSHTCEHANLEKWRGKRVAVLGRGQSACESAALLKQAGSEVELICRGPIHWLGVAQNDVAQDRRWLRRTREILQAPSAVGPPPWNWLNELPAVEHRLPALLRSWISTRSLRPAAAAWVKERFAGVQVHTTKEISSAVETGNGIVLRIGGESRLFDHVLLATGYKTNIARYRMLPRGLKQRIVRKGGSPKLTRGLESTVTGLHFAGAAAVESFGPLMRFIAGSGYAARAVTRAVLAQRPRAERQSHLRMEYDLLARFTPEHRI